MEILKSIIQANSERNKLLYLKQMSVDLDKLRILIRLSKDLRFISVRQYGFEIEWRISDGYGRYRMDERTWTDWDTTWTNMSSGLDGMRIRWSAKAGQVYFDHIAENLYEAPVISAIIEPIMNVQ